LLLAHDWASSQVRSVRGTVAVDVQPGTPSEVVMVVERP
jgi:hypothetical protein